MDALATIAFEIQATVTGVFAIALIVILQFLDLRRAKQNHLVKMLELSDSSRSGERRPSWSLKKYRLISGFSLFLQFIFGFIVLAIFSCWALYLATAGYRVSAAFSVITALVGIVMPFVVWITSRRKNKEMAQLIKDTEIRPRIAAESEKIPSFLAREAAVAEIKEILPEPAVPAPPIAEAPSVPEPAPVVTIAPKVAVSGISEKIPEDSMLRRHYLTHIQTRRQSWVSARPTDSMLRRHYDALMASRQQPSSKPEPPPPAHAEPMTVAEPEIGGTAAGVREGPLKEKLPQDSMLRRHYLSVLQSRFESGLPPRPTDSMLKRHFDGWKNVLIDRELGKYIESMKI